MSIKSGVRKLPSISSSHIPISHRRFQNRAAAIYDMSITCHDIETICHIHRLSASIILQDWKGDINYLKNRVKLNDKNDIKKRFLKIMKEIEHDHIQPTLAAIVHNIPFVYIEQAITEKDITNALNRFLNDFNPNTFNKTQKQENNVLERNFGNGQPILTPFEQYLVLQHLNESISIKKFRTIDDIENCLLQYIQSILKTNYSKMCNVSYLNKTWLKTFLQWAHPHMNSLDISWLNITHL